MLQWIEHGSLLGRVFLPIDGRPCPERCYVGPALDSHGSVLIAAGKGERIREHYRAGAAPEELRDKARPRPSFHYDSLVLDATAERTAKVVGELGHGRDLCGYTVCCLSLLQPCNGWVSAAAASTVRIGSK